MVAGPLRILHLHSSFSLGGKEARAVRLMNVWGDKATHTILSGVSGQLGARDAIETGIAVAFPLDAPSLTGQPSLRRYRALAFYMQRFDLVLSYNWGAMDAVMAHRLFASVMRLPPLIHHEDGFNSDEADGLKFRRNLFRRIALSTATALVVPSEKLEAIAMHDWKQPRERVWLIRNGIDIARYERIGDPAVIPGLVRRPGKLLVGTLAGLRPVKNLPRLVRAVGVHKDELQLVIVGEGAEREIILAEAVAMGLDDLHLPGFMAKPWQFVGLFDIFALSSDSEQFPVSLVEAMAAGCPVVSTDVGDVAHMVAPENRPFIVQPDDEGAFSLSLGKLASGAKLRADIGIANRAKARLCFAEADMIAAYARLYGQAIARPGALL